MVAISDMYRNEREKIETAIDNITSDLRAYCVFSKLAIDKMNGILGK